MHLASHYLPGPRTRQLWTGFAQRMPPSRMSCIRRLLATTVMAKTLVGNYHNMSNEAYMDSIVTFFDDLLVNTVLKTSKNCKK